MRLFATIILFILSVSSKGQTNQELLAMSPREFFAHPITKQVIDIENPNDHLLTVATFQATNLLREKLNLPRFLPDRTLYNASNIHIKEMTTNNFVAHINPYSIQYKTPSNRVKASGGNFYIVAENIALVPLFQSKKEGKYMYRKVNNSYRYYQTDGRPLRIMTYGEFGRSLVTDWYNSIGHRKNLINQNLTHLGLSVRVIKNKQRGGDLPEAYAVQNFGSKL